MSESKIELKPKCVIQWITLDGKSSGDNNESVGVAWTISMNHKLPNGDVVFIEESPECYPICAEHVARMEREKLVNWRFKPYA